MPTPKTTTKGAKKRPKTKAKKRASPPAPSHIRGDATARRLNRGGRPTKLTGDLIKRFLGFLSEGLHVAHCAALCGLMHTQLTDYLRIGTREAAAGKRTIRARFSAAVREGIAKLQRRELRTLSDVERIALGWDPLCKACRGKVKGCGKHPMQIKLAADIARWRLVHRHPKDWHVGTISIEQGGDEASTALVPGSAGDAGDGPKTVNAALVMYIPARRDDLD